jgi:hypothetical protein
MRRVVDNTLDAPFVHHSAEEKMDRSGGVIATLLCAVIAVQGWMLWKTADPLIADETAPELPKNAASAEPVIGSSAAMAERLARIDARLAAMERQITLNQASQEAWLPPESIDPQAMAEADRRLASIISDAEFDQDDMRKLDSALAHLSKDEKYQLMTAFARAVNTDRIKLRM